MVEQVGACHTVGGGTVGTVVDPYHSVGLKSVADRSLDAIVVDTEAAPAVQVGGIAHVKHLVTADITTQSQCLALGITAVVHLRGAVEFQFTCHL